MQKVSLFILIALLSGCVTQKKCNSKFPPEVITNTKDSIVYKDTVIYRDKIVEITIPGDTVEVDKPVPVKENISPIWANTEYASASAWVENSKLKLQLIQKEQKIKVIIDSAYKDSRIWREKYFNEKRVVTIREKYIPGFYKFAAFSFIGIIIAICGYVAFKIFR